MRAAVFLAASLCGFSVQARVLDFHSDIRLAKSGELTVTERISVQAQGKTPGLVRELPQAARVVDVIRDGHPEPYALDAGRLRIGGAGVAEGRHLYQVTYRCARRVAFLADHDALHWNLRGGERITAEVVLPVSVPAREIKVEVVTGARGEQGGDYQSFVRDGRAAFRGKDGMAIVVRFPKGVVAEPGIGQRARWFFSDYFGALLVLAMLGLTAWVLVVMARMSARSRGY